VGGIANLVRAAMLVVKERLGLEELRLAVTIATDLEMLLVLPVAAQEAGEARDAQFGPEILADPSDEAVVGFRVDRRIVVEAVDVPGRVGNDGHLLVAQGALGLVGDLGAVEPHGLGDEPSVVGKDTVLHVDEVLRMERREDQIDVLQRDAADDKRRGGVQRRQRDALAGRPVVARPEAKGLHRLDRLGLPVGNHVAVVLVEPEMLADVDVEVVLIARVAEQRVAAGDLLGTDHVPEAVDFRLLFGQAPGLQVEVEVELVHDVLPHSHQPAVARLAFELGEAIDLTPPPQQRAHDVGQHEAVHQLREDEHLHVRERDRRRILLQVLRVHPFDSSSQFHCCRPTQPAIRPARRRSLPEIAAITTVRAFHTTSEREDESTAIRARPVGTLETQVEEFTGFAT